MATYTTQPITVDIQPTTKFSDYKNKIENSLEQFGTHVNTELTNMFDTLSTETTYTKAEQDTQFTARYTKDEINGAIGNISSPLLDLPLQNSLTMKAGAGSVNFTRSTTATYIDRYGVLKIASVDEPRFEKDGLLIEGVSTNIALHSEDHTNWNKYNSTSVTDTTIANPYGNLSTPKVTGTSAALEHYIERSESGLTSGTDTYTASVFVKKGTQDTIKFATYFTGGTNRPKITMFTFSTKTSNNSDCTVQELDNGWFRLSLPITDNDSGNTELKWRVYVNDGTYVDTSTDYIYVFGGQLEKLSFASSYIPTTSTAVTRGGDVMKVDFQGNHPSLKAGNPFSIHIKYDTHPVLTFERVILQSGTSAYLDYHSLLRINKDSSSLLYYRAPVGVGKQNAYKGSACVTIDESELTNLYFNGVLSNGKVQHLTNTAGTNSTIYIGSNSGGNNQIFGHISHYKVYDKVLTATEVALLG